MNSRSACRRRPCRGEEEKGEEKRGRLPNLGVTTVVRMFNPQEALVEEMVAGVSCGRKKSKTVEERGNVQWL